MKNIGKFGENSKKFQILLKIKYPQNLWNFEKNLKQFFKEISERQEDFQKKST